VVSKSDILSSRQIIAALFFRNLFGPSAGKFLSAFIAFSTMGNLLAGQFSQSRVLQELGREGVFPYSSVFASNKPFGAPLAALCMLFLVSCTLILGPPAYDVYLLLINTSSYSLSIINTAVSLGLLLLYTSAFKERDWNPPFRAWKPIVVIFFSSNVYLLVIPLMPPADGRRVYEHLPYWLHVFVSYALSVFGILYWYIWCKWLPRRNGYKLERVWVLQDDNVSRCVLEKVNSVSVSL